MRRETTFLLTGLIGGLACVLPGESILMLLTLTWGVGPGFFGAVVAGIVITCGWRHLQDHLLRYFVGLVCCVVTYLVALMVFFGVYGFSPNLFAFKPSDNIDQFGIDVGLGLVAAGAFAASGITLFAFVLSGRWSNSVLLRLLLAGIVTIVVTFIVNLPFRSYWSFYGVLLPLGSALFCYLVGVHILRGKAETQVAASATQPHQRPA